MRSTAAAAFLLLLVAACGDAPTGPDPGGKLDIVGDGFVYVASPATLKLEVVSTSGLRSPAPSPQWRSDRPDVISVDSSGVVMGIMPGVATITGQSGSLPSALRQLHSVEDYRGNWVGQFAASSCSREGDFPLTNFCSTIGQSMSTLRLAIDQNGTTTAGSISLLGAEALVQGAVDDTGALHIDTSVQSSTGVGLATVRVQQWQSKRVGDQMTGTLTMLWSFEGRGGSALVGAAVVMNHTQ